MSIKACKRCKVSKPLEEFYNDALSEDGKRASCKHCVLSRRDLPKIELPLGHKKCNGCEEIKKFNEFWADKANKTNGRYSYCIVCKNKSTYAWREKNKDYYNKTMREYRASMPPMKRRDIDLKSWFDLPYGWYEKTLQEQDNKCAICKKPNSSTKRCLAVDHCHETGKVRGILCYGCNRLMVLLDDAELLERALAYKKKAA